MADLKTKLRNVLASPYMVDLAKEALVRIEKLERQAEGLCDGCGEPLDDAFCFSCAEKLQPKEIDFITGK